MNVTWKIMRLTLDELIDMDREEFLRRAESYMDDPALIECMEYGVINRWGVITTDPDEVQVEIAVGTELSGDE